MSDIMEMLTEVVTRDHPSLAEDFLDWLEDNLNKDGPWNTNTCPKTRINSFLKYALAMQGSLTTKARRYLDVGDRDEIWCRSIARVVLPHLEQEIRM